MALGPAAQLLFGLATFVPGVTRLVFRGTGGTDSARYCYSVWLRHLVLASRSGLNTAPKMVAELGPGDSLGIGIAALLTGAESYSAFDVMRHADLARNVAVLDELVELFQDRAPIPDEYEFPNLKPVLSDYAFPHDILPTERLGAALDARRVDWIRGALRSSSQVNSPIRYCAPWFEQDVLEEGTVDIIFSQAVLEHVDDLLGAYDAMHRWLRPSGFMSHQIDFKCHGTAHEWNGHWKYSDFHWKLIRGNRPYLLNRQPHSVHVDIMKKTGFEIVRDDPNRTESSLSRAALAPRYRDLSDDDLSTSGAFIQARIHS